MTPLALFFDIGDTLVFDDPPLHERFRQAAQSVGFDYPATDFLAAYQTGERYALTRYLDGVETDTPTERRETATRVLEALGAPPLSDTLWHRLAEAFAAVRWVRYVHPDAIGLLQTLRARGFLLGAISDWDATLPDLLAEMALAPLLDALSVSVIVGVTKPHSRLFLDALHQLAVPADRALHIGDWYELDICGARAVGMEAILFDHAQRRPNADCPRVETFAALSEMLLRLERS